MEQKNEGFHYVYSAKQQEEIQTIRRKYAAPTEDKMEKLRRLDANVTRKATAIAVTVGVIGTLLMGAGMSLAMSEFGQFLGPKAMVVGVAIGVVGMGILAVAYPLYIRTLRRERQKAAPDILRLTEELMQ